MPIAPILLLASISLLSSLCMAAPLRFLAFGDSLTAGMYRKELRAFDINHHPYTIKLLSLLQTKLPNTTEVIVVNQGVSGEQVLLTMPARLDQFLKEAEGNGTRYDFILLMAGINDIGMGATGEAVMKGLEQMYERISRHKARFLAMTTMTLSASDKPFYFAAEKEREKLNKLIRHWIASGDRVKAQGSAPILVDLDQLIRYTNTTNLFCPDGLHLSPLGYDKMGEEIFHGLEPFLNEKL